MLSIRFGAVAVLAMSIMGAAAAMIPAAPAGGSDDADAYGAHCAGCHGSRLGGSSGPAIGPALKGEAFVAKWGKTPPADFLAFVQATMPYNQPGSLDAATSAQAANHVLAENGLATAKSMAGIAPDTVMTADAMRLPVRDEDRDDAYRAAMSARAALLAGLKPVDDAMLVNPPKADWVSWRGSAATLGYSGLDQVDRGNVRGLGLAWSLGLASGTNAIAPLVHDGVMFIQSNGTVQALDARNGDQLWKYTRAAIARGISGQTRSIALYGDAVYVPTIDNHMIALDAKSGKLLWDHVIAGPDEPVHLTAAPIAARGKIIQGMSGCNGDKFPGGCYIVALDAATGKELWRFHTIARPGEPGGDSWNGAPLNRRFGGSVWVTGSYDADLKLLFFGVGQTYTVSSLLDRQVKPGKSNDALYTDATLALDPDTGKLVWAYQHVAGDVWDLDWSFERTVVSLGGRKVVLTAGKMGIFDALDAKTGRYLWSYDLGLQNLVTAIDPKTGRKTLDKALIPDIGPPKFVCPSSIGNRNWMATAYDPRSAIIYVPVIPTCMVYGRHAPTGKSDLRDYGEVTVDMRRRPGSDGNHGWVAALDVANRKIVWIDKRRAPEVSAALTTGGGLVFGGGRDRSFRAADSATGATLWQTRLPAVPNGFPISYMVDGVQYVAVVAGGGTPAEAYVVPMTPELPPSDGSRSIMVFALPKAP